jgi:ABC-2 type transport system permease protein
MKGVIEEKTNRIIEIIISSVSSFQLMIAKIIGIGFVGLTQFIIWVSVIFIMSSTILSSTFPNIYSSNFQSEAIQLNEISNEQIQFKNEGVSEILQFILYEVNWPSMFLFFGIFFIFGYLLYGSLMAAIGSAVDEETDTQQFILPITIPLGFSLLMITKVIDNPSSTLSFWLSEIPFTSPIIMMVRIAMGIGDSSVELWEIILSIVILILTFIGTTFISARIYKKGILSFGKKASYRDLFKWIKS